MKWVTPRRHDRPIIDVDVTFPYNDVDAVYGERPLTVGNVANLTSYASSIFIHMALYWL